MKSKIDYEKRIKKFLIKKEGQGVTKKLRTTNLIKSGLLDQRTPHPSVFISNKFNIKIDISNEKI